MAVLLPYTIDDDSELQQQPVSTNARRTARGAARLAGSVVTYSAAPVLQQVEAASAALRVLSRPDFTQTPALQLSDPDFSLVTPQSLMAQSPVWAPVAQAASANTAFQQRVERLKDPSLCQYLAQEQRREQRRQDTFRIHEELKKDPVFDRVSQHERFRLAENIAGHGMTRQQAQEEAYPTSVRRVDQALQIREQLKTNPTFSGLDSIWQLRIAEKMRDGHMNQSQAESTAAWAKGLTENSNPQYEHLDASTRHHIVTLTLDGDIDRNMSPNEAAKKVREIVGDLVREEVTIEVLY